nr:hypothetical protein [Tanacetum cinerariifolium]
GYGAGVGGHRRGRAQRNRDVAHANRQRPNLAQVGGHLRRGRGHADVRELEKAAGIRRGRGGGHQEGHVGGAVVVNIEVVDGPDGPAHTRAIH